MTQSNRQTATRGGRNRPPKTPKWSTLAAIALAWGILPAAAPAQTSLPPVDAEAIYLRLEQQEAEIQWLRSRLSGVQGQTSVGFTDPSASPRYQTQAHYTAAEVNEFEDMKRRLASLEQEQAKAKLGKPASDGWIDVSNEKWNIKLGGHIQMDYITWANADPDIADADNYFNFRRLRLVADGTGYGQFDFRLQMTLEPGQGSLGIQSAIAAPSG